MKKSRYLTLTNYGLMMASLVTSFSLVFELIKSETKALALGLNISQNIAEQESGSEQRTSVDGAEEEQSETLGVVGEVLIKSFNPGFSEVGEFLELTKISRQRVSLAGLTIIYTTSAGSTYEIYVFPEGSELVGETLLMRLASSEEVKSVKDAREVADVIYTRNMAQGGGKIELVFEGSVIDSLCWGSGEGCYEAFNTKRPTSLVRKIVQMEGEPSVDLNELESEQSEPNEQELEKSELESEIEPKIEPESEETAQESGSVFVHDETYRPNYDPEQPGLVIREVEFEPENLGSDRKKEPPGTEDDRMKEDETIEPEVGRQCEGIEFSEILTYYTEAADEQFIELFNRNDGTVQLEQCLLRYKKNDYPLKGELGANSYLALYPQVEWNLKLTKNPTSANKLELINLAGLVIDTLEYQTGQKQGVSLALIEINEAGQEVWQQSYLPTPGEANIYQQYKTCPVGKVINIETGNCVTETALAPTLAACPEGKYRNPLTGRCKSYETIENSEKACAEGYERNPDTGRCRKIVANDGAAYPVEINTGGFRENREFLAMGATVVIVTIGLGYILFQYREELYGIWHKQKNKKQS